MAAFLVEWVFIYQILIYKYPCHAYQMQTLTRRVGLEALFSSRSTLHFCSAPNN